MGKVCPIVFEPCARALSKIPCKLWHTCNWAEPTALMGDTNKARSAYQDFLALWKDADPDIPILQQAKAEYLKLL